MRRITLILALSVAALAQQTLTVDQLSKFLYSTTHDMKGKQSDQEISKYLSGIKLRERLDNDAIEQMQVGLGPKTIAALKTLRDRTANLPAAQPVTAIAEPQQPPPPSSEEQATILDAVRRYALEYSSTLPDFVCHESLDTFAAPRREGSGWTPVSKIDSKLTYFKQREAYSPVMENGKFTSTDYEKLKGSKSVGDFGTMMRGIFEPASQTRFEWRGWAVHDNKRAMEFNYRVPQEHSNYQISAEGASAVTPGYSGYFQVDPKTHVIWKLTLVAEDLPKSFPVQSAESSMVYEYKDLSGQMFLLPAQYEAIMSGPDGRDKIEKRFSIYRKYTVTDSISFGDDVPDTPPPGVKKK